MKKLILLAFMGALSASSCVPVIYQSISQTDDNKITISGNKGNQAVALECTRTSEKVDCKSQYPATGLGNY
ncbi:MAG: hypothetical protein GY866_30290 [Proteobacteria bacterium]|nr:hypothetical protein [Pseudomonadota bacterium]